MLGSLIGKLINFCQFSQLQEENQEFFKYFCTLKVEVSYQIFYNCTKCKL